MPSELFFISCAGADSLTRKVLCVFVFKGTSVHFSLFFAF